MFNKLKSFSEDVAKSLNEFNNAEVSKGPGSEESKLRMDRLARDARILKLHTPDAEQLKQPEDDTTGPIKPVNNEVSEEGLTENSVNATLSEADISQSPLIRAKLKKFQKYEEKYPLLFEAYKIEKRKNSLITDFERVLREYTPIENISQAEDLVGYLKDLTDKNNILQTEMKNFLKQEESNKLKIQKLEDSKAFLKNLLEEYEEKFRSENVGERHSKGLDSSQENSTISEDEFRSMQSENEKLKEELEEMKSKCEETQSLNKRGRSFEEELQVKSNEVNDLTLKLSDVNKELETQTMRVEELNKEILTLKNTSELSTNRSDEKSQNNGALSGTVNKNDKRKKKAKNKSPTKSIQVDTKENIDLLNTESKSLKAELDSVIVKYRETKDKLLSKSEEVEELRDTLKSVGSDLVACKERIKAIESPESHDCISTDNDKNFYKEHENLIKEKKALEEQMKSKELSLSEMKKDHLHKVDLLENKLKSKDEEIHQKTEALVQLQKQIDDSNIIIADLKKLHENDANEIVTLNQSIKSLELRNKELCQIKSSESSVKLELVSLKSKLDNKENQLKDLTKNYQVLQNENQRVIDEFKKSDNISKRFEIANKSLNLENHKLLTQQEKLNSELRKHQSVVQSLEEEVNMKEKDKLFYKSMSETLEKEIIKLKEQSESLQQHYSELKLSNKDSSHKHDGLLDQMADLEKELEMKSSEISNVRRLLIQAEEKIDSQALDLKSQIFALNEEKEDIQNSYSLLLKKKQRENNDLKLDIESVTKTKEALEQKIAHLTFENESLKTSLDKKEVGREENEILNAQDTIEKLRNNLLSCNSKIKEYEKLNSMLKRANEEANLKNERLSRNYKLINQQFENLQNSKAQGSNSSPNFTNSNKTEQSKPSFKETNIAYLKNVLLGFFEYRDQREKLLPVLKTLFDFSNEEEKRFLSALN